MGRLITLLAVASALAGCGASGADADAACVDFIDAWATCSREAYAEAYAEDAEAAAQTYELPDSTCDGIDELPGAAARDGVELYHCYADTLTDGDCSTPEAFSTTGADISSCIGS